MWLGLALATETCTPVRASVPHPTYLTYEGARAAAEVPHSILPMRLEHWNGAQWVLWTEVPEAGNATEVLPLARLGATTVVALSKELLRIDASGTVTRSAVENPLQKSPRGILGLNDEYLVMPSKGSGSLVVTDPLGQAILRHPVAQAPDARAYRLGFSPLADGHAAFAWTEITEPHHRQPQVGVWTLGTGPAGRPPPPRTGFVESVGLLPSHEPIVAISGWNAGQLTTTIHAYDGAWTQLGAEVLVSPPGSVALDLLTHEGVPWLATVEKLGSTYAARVRHWDGAAWLDDPLPAMTAGFRNEPVLWVHGDTLYLSMLEETETTVWTRTDVWWALAREGASEAHARSRTSFPRQEVTYAREPAGWRRLPSASRDVAMSSYTHSVLGCPGPSRPMPP